MSDQCRLPFEPGDEVAATFTPSELAAHAERLAGTYTVHGHVYQAGGLLWVGRDCIAAFGRPADNATVVFITTAHEGQAAA